MDNKTVVPPQKKLLQASPEKVIRRKKKGKKARMAIAKLFTFHANAKTF